MRRARSSRGTRALASALRKIAGGAAARPLPEEDRLVAQSHLMIEIITNPFRGHGMASMFAGHPQMESGWPGSRPSPASSASVEPVAGALAFRHV